MRLRKRKLFRHIIYRLPILVVSVLMLSTIVFSHSNQYVTQCSSASSCTTNSIMLSGKICGGGANAVTTSIDFGCLNKGNPINDIIFAIIRFLSAGVGIVVVMSVIIGGIQYIMSRGDPNATQAAIGRLTSAVTALIVYIFAYAILNFVIPGGFFN